MRAKAENDTEYAKVLEIAKSQLGQLLEPREERQRRIIYLRRLTDGLRALVKEGAGEFRSVLERADKELGELSESHKRNESSIANLQNVVEGAEGLVRDGDSDLVPYKKQDDDLTSLLGETSTSLTASIRRFFGRSPNGAGFTTGEVKDALRDLDLKRYKQPLVPIHNTLQRLVAQRELKSDEDESGPRCYTALPLLYQKLESDEQWRLDSAIEELNRR
jgi:hypothetical protein